MKIITISGHKNSEKVKLAEKWDRNENVSLINPVTTKERDDFIHLTPYELESKIEEERPLLSTIIDAETYCYFPSQLKNDWNIFILDDLCLKDLKDNFDGKIVTVWVKDPKAEKSMRTGLIYRESDYDYVFNVGMDDPDEFLEQLAFDVEFVQ